MFQNNRLEWLLVFSGVLVVILIWFVAPGIHTTGMIFGYGLGVLSAFSHLVMIRIISNWPQNSFLLVYYLGTVARILLTLLLFVLFLVLVKEGQISFTLSFIISYIFHSVVDGIFINKTFTINKLPDNR